MVITPLLDGDRGQHRRVIDERPEGVVDTVLVGQLAELLSLGEVLEGGRRLFALVALQDGEVLSAVGTLAGSKSGHKSASSPVC